MNTGYAKKKIDSQHEKKKALDLGKDRKGVNAL